MGGNKLYYVEKLSWTRGQGKKKKEKKTSLLVKKKKVGKKGCLSLGNRVLWRGGDEISIKNN